MPKIKVPRKSTVVDMTAMCDVAFLLLTFFILTARFKPSEVVAVDIPNARSQKTLEGYVAIFVDKEGKAFVSVKETATRYEMITQMIERYGEKYPNLKSLTENDKKFFALIDLWGTPIGDMQRVLKMNGEEFKKYQEKQMPGIPFDSLNNQLGDWVQSARYATGGDIKIAIKSDKNTNIQPVKQIVKTLTERDIHRFNLITTLSGGGSVEQVEAPAEK
jgi:biopolymer transport protein ExbD